MNRLYVKTFEQFVNEIEDTDSIKPLCDFNNQLDKAVKKELQRERKAKRNKSTNKIDVSF